MAKFRYPSFRSTLFVASLTLIVGFASAQTASQVISREPTLNVKIQEAAQPYKDDPRRASESLMRFEALNSQASNDPDVQSWLGFLYIQTGAPEKAIPPLELAAAKRPENLEVRINLGNAYFASRPPQYDKALASYKTVSEGRPSMSEPRYNSGVIYIQKGDYPKAITELKAAEALDPKNAFIKNNLGVAYEKSKDDKDASVKFREASDLKPDDKTFARNAGLSILKTRPPAPANTKPIEDQARPYLERASDDDPAVALALGGMSMSNKQKALELYSKAEKGIDNPKFSNKERETYWYNVGVLRDQTGDSSGAIRAYDHALAINPNDLDALKNVGMIHYRRAETIPGDKAEYVDAKMAFDKLTGLNPTSFEAWKNLGLAAIRSNDREKAITAYREATKLGGADRSDDLIQVRLGLGDALYDKGDRPGAAAEYHQVLLMQKDNAEALNGLGLIYLDGKKYAQAEAVLRSAIASNPKYAAAYNNLGIALDNLYRRKEAIGMLEKAHRLDPGNANINENLRKLKSASPHP